MINVSFVYPPIPDRRFDYSATWEGYEEGDAVGYGVTPAAAIEELLEMSDGDRDEADQFKSHIERLSKAIAPLLTGFKWEVLTEEQQQVIWRGMFAADSVWRAYTRKPIPTQETER